MNNTIKNEPGVGRGTRELIVTTEVPKEEPVARINRFKAAALGAADFVKLEIERPKSLLGHGLLVAGGLGILYGKPGLGKSWFAVSLARSMARGEPWMGIPTVPSGVRAGVVQLELGAFTLQERLITLGAGTHERDQEIKVVCRPRLRGLVDLFRAQGDIDDLHEWISDDKLDVLFIDALSRAHSANENKAEELGQVIARLDVIRHETGCAIVPIHHETKATDKDPNNHLDALRGTTRLQSDPTLLVRVQQLRGIRRIVFAKVSEGAEPHPIYFRLGEDGQPEVIPAPEDVSDANRDRVLKSVSGFGRPVQISEVMSATRMTRATVKRHLTKLADGGFLNVLGQGKDTSYSKITGSTGSTGSGPRTSRR